MKIKQEDKPELKISMLGEFSARYKEKKLFAAETADSKVLQLFLLMVLHKNMGIDKNILLRNLYGDEAVKDPDNKLDGLVDFLRNKLIESGLPEAPYIEAADDIYRWECRISLRVDVFEFEDIIRSAQIRQEKEKIKLLEQACSCFFADFLPQMGTELWVIAEGKRYKRLYENCVLYLYDYYKKNKKYEKMCEISLAASTIYPYSEWQLYQIGSLILLEKYGDAYELYRAVVDRYQEETGRSYSKSMMERLHMISGRPLGEMGNAIDIQDITSVTEEKGAYYVSFPRHNSSSIQR